MCCEKDCYFCKHLYFCDINDMNEFICILTGLSYQKAKLKTDCDDFSIEYEE